MSTHPGHSAIHPASGARRVRGLLIALAIAAAAANPAMAQSTNPGYGPPTNSVQPLSPTLTAPALGTGPSDISTAGPTFGTAPDAYDPSASYAAQSATYTLRPGDVISINVFGQPAFSESAARILPDGSVTLALVGSVRIGGQTPAKAARTIDGALKAYLLAPQTTIAVLQVAPVSVLLLGAIRVPGKYALGPQSRLMDAIAAGGGLAPIDGDLPDARIETGTATIETVSLQKLFGPNADLTLNRPLENGMTIYIPSPNTFQVQVFGAIDHPGDVIVRDGDRLSMAVARAGVSTNSQSDLNHVFLRRNNPDGSITQQTINLYAVIESKDVTADPVLRKNDLIQIPKSKGGSNNGSVLQSLIYLVTPRI